MAGAFWLAPQLDGVPMVAVTMPTTRRLARGRDKRQTESHRFESHAHGPIGSHPRRQRVASEELPHRLVRVDQDDPLADACEYPVLRRPHIERAARPHVP